MARKIVPKLQLYIIVDIKEVFIMARTTKTDIEDAYYARFPTRLRLLLDRKGETQGKLADAIEVHRQSIGQWKDGTTVPDIYALKKIADYYNVSSDYLLGLSDDPQRKPSAVDQLGLTPAARDIIEGQKKHHPDFGKLISDIVESGHFIMAWLALGVGLEAYEAGKEYEAKKDGDKQDFEQYRQAASAHGVVVLPPVDAAGYYFRQAKEDIICCVDGYIDRKIAERDRFWEAFVPDDEDD